MRLTVCKRENLVRWGTRAAAVALFIATRTGCSSHSAHVQCALRACAVLNLKQKRVDCEPITGGGGEMELFTGNAWPFRLGVSLRHEIAMSEWARAIAEWYCKNSAGFWGRSVHMEFLHTIYWVYTECQMKMKWRIYMTICFSRLSLSLSHTYCTYTHIHTQTQGTLRSVQNSARPELVQNSIVGVHCQQIFAVLWVKTAVSSPFHTSSLLSKKN